jgi:hypothetical protein
LIKKEPPSKNYLKGKGTLVSPSPGKISKAEKRAAVHQYKMSGRTAGETKGKHP